MKTYTVHHRSGTPAGILADPDGAVFIKEGMSWPALVVPFFWALWNRLWIVAALIFAAGLGLWALAPWLGLPGGVAFVISGLLNLLIALEGGELRRWTLERNGFVLTGLVSAPSEFEAEQIYFERLGQQNTAPERTRATPQPVLRLESGPEEDGLFPVSGSLR